MLHVPVGRAGLPPLSLSIRGIRGREARLAAVSNREIRERNHHAILGGFMICGCLWWWFWIQFLIGWLFGLPALHTLSGGKWVAPVIDYFIHPNGQHGIPLSKSLFALSVFGCAMAISGSWLHSAGAASAWKVRGAVAVFCVLPLGWSLAALLAEDAAWARLRAEEKSILADLGAFEHYHDRMFLRMRLDTVRETLAREPEERKRKTDR